MIIENIKGELIYEDNGFVFVKLDEENHPMFDPDKIQIGEYNSFEGGEEVAIIFVESWEGTCGISDLGAGVSPPEDHGWAVMGEFEIVQSPDSEGYCCPSSSRMGYRLWDTGIRLPRAVWWSAAL